MSTETPLTQETLSSLISSRLSATHITITDMSGGCGSAYAALIVSPLFHSKTTLARHRLVNTALKQEIAGIHAWTPKCYTPEEWEKVAPKGEGEGSEKDMLPGKEGNGEVMTGTRE